MNSPPQHYSPETRQRAIARMRRLTCFAALAATGATVAIGLVVAKEHPGASASSSLVPAQVPTTSAPTTTSTTSPTTTSTTSPPTTSTTSPPTTTTTRPVVTSGGTSR